MDAQTLRQTFLDHLRANGHTIVGAAPLIAVWAATHAVGRRPHGGGIAREALGAPT